ncbi:Rv2578c family radical SAM protein [Rhodococcus rhodochrous]|uniref:Rv2578c family radical SAM protein n=1 Tax=Rhodococcus rhodochrous TaxID=1829 RepID=UPI001E333DBD|nr:Rv2578c family radical SAM protein [Rhodococcus rhodochrous]MCD2095731.1 Rv2578c family radical SAM protein [Rhodococcus rhodochrous]MCD2119835.1 Rv2578c family radical SAM protein [Rhodococcus rhodochrous]MCQ4134837.1 Rv2578c family radical SAM protein [Rhodococcus rhodochrous]MDJ0016700.1 Rv2578c family radical SAM protein [Rhodococcus rhodochrous]
MRWAGQTVDADDGALPGLERAGLVRSVRTPEFEGVTFHEVLCKSALNRTPEASRLPFRYTVNTFRGCTHACRYCFARPTHEYLDLDAGHDFDSQVVVKTNVAAVLRRELTRRSWTREHVALGTNTDPYQRAEGRYRLMPGVIRAFAESGTPFSILTKGTLLRRDLPLLSLAAGQVDVSVAVSLPIGDPELAAHIEPGTPSPKARLDLVKAIVDAGLSCHVMVAPVLPFLTDSRQHLDTLFGSLAAAGASGVTVIPLHLRGSTRGWFLSWLAQEHPALMRRYRRLYGRGAYVAPEYSQWLDERVAPLLERHRLGVRASARREKKGALRTDEHAPEPEAALTLF